MRWIEPEPASRRVVKKFAFIPICIGREVRWLETVRIVQKWDYIHRIWVNDRFVGDEE